MRIIQVPFQFFNFRWNDFEANVSNSFRELRRDNEFFDVTLCCDNGIDTLQAHKVILAACSPLFRRILGPTSNQRHGGTSINSPLNTQPLLYLKGIHMQELEAVLDFMYHGEVNVAQDALNAFLAVAEELAVKGLTTEGKSDGIASRGLNHRGRGEDFGDTDSDFTPTKKGEPLKRISFGGDKGSLKKNVALGHASRSNIGISSQVKLGGNIKKRSLESSGDGIEIGIRKRVKDDPDNIQIGEATSLAVPEGSSSDPGAVDPGDFADEGSGEPDYEDGYTTYAEGELEESGSGPNTGSDISKGRDLSC